MRRKFIWILLLTFGVSSSVLSSCTITKIIDGRYLHDYLYVNITGHSAEITGYAISGEESWTAYPSDTLKISFDMMEEVPLYPLVCDSVRVVFDDGKAVMFRSGEPAEKNMLSLKEYSERVLNDGHHCIYQYVIDEALYQTASAAD